MNAHTTGPPRRCDPRRRAGIAIQSGSRCSSSPSRCFGETRMPSRPSGLMRPSLTSRSINSNGWPAFLCLHVRNDLLGRHELTDDVGISRFRGASLLRFPTASVRFGNGSVGAARCHRSQQAGAPAADAHWRPSRDAAFAGSLSTRSRLRSLTVSGTLDRRVSRAAVRRA